MGVSNALSALADPLKNLRDWRLIALVVFVTALAALINLYVTAAAIRFLGRLMGSVAGRERIRIAMAWGAVPLAWGALFSALPLVLQWETSNTVLTKVVIVSLGVAAIWSFVATVAMLMEVQQLSAVRAFACYAGATLLIVLFVALPIRIFLWQPFNIPSGASVPTLLVGDYFFVSKYSYGYSRYSFPFGLHLFNGRIFFSQPERGDVIVFRTPTDNSTDYIQRLVGLPGDRIQMIDGVLNINGVPVTRERVEDKIEDTKCGRHMPVHIYRETLPNGRSYLTQKLSETCPVNRLGAADNTGVFAVPPMHYFMLGDNRDDSADSRFAIGNGVGYVPEENLVGRAEVIFLSVSKDDNSRVGRLLNRVR
jgi:signal peptidase I